MLNNAFSTEAQATRTRLSITLNLHCMFYYFCVSLKVPNAQNLHAETETCLYRPNAWWVMIMMMTMMMMFCQPPFVADSESGQSSNVVSPT